MKKTLYRYLCRNCGKMFLLYEGELVACAWCDSAEVEFRGRRND